LEVRKAGKIGGGEFWVCEKRGNLGSEVIVKSDVIGEFEVRNS